MRRISKRIHERKKMGEGFLEEEPVGKITEPMDFIEKTTEEPIEIAEEKIGVESAAKATFVPKPTKKDFRTIRKRRKIGEGSIVKEIEEKKAKAKKQILELLEELPKEYRKELLEKLLKKYE